MNAREMWILFTKNTCVENGTWEAWSFGDQADELAQLTVDGIKRVA